jgi:hypothetical protein
MFARRNFSKSTADRDVASNPLLVFSSDQHKNFSAASTVCCPPAPFGLRRDNFSRTLLREKLVENTGLEPVTSWLQTRRSPS